ncbi:hypothetical protein AU255_06465 [Methyloprofundus sedimenti]|uniref:DUF4124 domain-containing protein n=1 Tax=Methyloprofundus sedimenti TaxID=1420851 RepID=A0A1V8M7K5_9GAMM|nr:hypothetical protein [Methyloprofundus sedimenti]OQK17512.1 hypothetical protein AU255_06465 [Methyloprofundus sedimenti]
MKIISTLILILAISPVYAEIYKCEENGIISYQQFPCKEGGTEFIPPKDISPEQQKAAIEKLDREIAIQAEQKQQQQEADDKERLIRAQEEKADAAAQNARANTAQVLQNARQTEQIRNQNQRPYFPIAPVNPPDNFPIAPTDPIIPEPLPANN